MRYAGIVVAGGPSGVDKPSPAGRNPLLARAIHALDGAERVIAVGPRRPGFDVLWTRQPVPGTVAAVAAGLAFVPDDAEAVAVLADGFPGVRRSTVDRLVAAIGDGDGAVLVDAAGARRWLLGAWRVAALRDALPGDPADASLPGTLAGLRIADVRAELGEADVIDPPDDLERRG
ncbi:molybdenum cofactor guanylyltransferase [Amycolatopsis stemonae]